MLSTNTLSFLWMFILYGPCAKCCHVIHYHRYRVPFHNFLINDFKAKEFPNELISRKQFITHGTARPRPIWDGMIVTLIILVCKVDLLEIILWSKQGHLIYRNKLSAIENAVQSFLTIVVTLRSMGKRVTQGGRDKMAAISQWQIKYIFSRIKRFRMKFHWNLFLSVQLTTMEHRIR